MRHAAFLALGAGDTLYVLDRVSRLLVFGPDGDFIRQGYYPGSGWGIIHLSDGSLVRNGDMFTGELSGRTFGRFTPLGDLLATLGDSIPRTPTTPAHVQIRSMWADDSAGFWAGTKYGRYTLDHWTAAGLAARYQIERDWFRTVSPEDELGLEMNAADGVVGGAIDSAGRLWVYVRVADPRRDQVRSVTMSGIEGSYQVPEDWDQVFDTVIEVFDAETLTLLASHRVDDYIRFVLGADRVMKIAEEDPGGLVATVYRVQLKEP
jgi:hypothetical protein